MRIIKGIKVIVFVFLFIVINLLLSYSLIHKRAFLAIFL